MNGSLLSAHIIDPIYPTHPHVGNSILMPKFLVRTFDHENGMFESMVCIGMFEVWFLSAYCKFLVILSGRYPKSNCLKRISSTF
jgi:hypothetical protein